MNVKMRAMACLLRSFLETAAHPIFRHNMFHEIMFRYHVLEEHDLPDPGLTPYYDEQFFGTLRHYHANSPLKISTMTIKQWYMVLMEDRLLMTPATDNNPQGLLPVRAETMSPNNDWPTTWRLIRLKGLNSELSAFLFKLIHCLLPTQDRVARLGAAEGQQPGMCLFCNLEIEDALHAFFSCPHSNVAGLALLGWVQGLVPDLSPEDALHLQLGGDMAHEEELAAVYMLATGWKFIWEARVSKKQIVLHQMRSELEANIAILRKSKFREAAMMMQGLLNN